MSSQPPVGPSNGSNQIANTEEKALVPTPTLSRQVLNTSSRVATTGVRFVVGAKATFTTVGATIKVGCFAAEIAAATELGAALGAGAAGAACLPVVAVGATVLYVAYDPKATGRALSNLTSRALTLFSGSSAQPHSHWKRCAPKIRAIGMFAAAGKSRTPSMVIILNPRLFQRYVTGDPRQMHNNNLQFHPRALEYVQSQEIQTHQERINEEVKAIMQPTRDLLAGRAWTRHPEHILTGNLAWAWAGVRDQARKLGHTEVANQADTISKAWGKVQREELHLQRVELLETQRERRERHHQEDTASSDSNSEKLGHKKTTKERHVTWKEPIASYHQDYTPPSSDSDSDDGIGTQSRRSTHRRLPTFTGKLKEIKIKVSSEKTTPCCDRILKAIAAPFSWLARSFQCLCTGLKSSVDKARSLASRYLSSRLVQATALTAAVCVIAGAGFHYRAA